MKRSTRITAVLLLLCVASFADIPRPDKTPKRSDRAINTDLDIRLDPKAVEARLIIPRSQLNQLRAELESLEGDANTAAAVSQFSRTQTIMSGLFLSLALVFGGLWFSRSRKGLAVPGPALVLLTVFATLGSAVSYVYANAGPPAEARSINAKMFAPAVHMYGHGWGKIKLEVDDGSRVQLIVLDPKTETKPAGEE